ncbi:MAG: ATP-binding cassette domain-containing protein [Firmicutes bacterium]|nr:ATP-binding cassette domain-containing protein [Bacillota bacterium]
MKISALKKTYKGRLVLDTPEMEFEAGNIYCIVGSNGSGKSTFAKILAGIVEADNKKGALENVGYMAQKSYAFNMSMEKNILINGDDKNRCRRLMECLKIDHLATSKAKTLSGGETAKMALARIMMKEYKVLILDEPTAAMDRDSVFLAEKLILDYKEETGCTVVLITHSYEQAKRISDKILNIEYGKLVI